MPDPKTTSKRELASMIELLPKCHSAAAFKESVLPQICDFFSASTAVLHYYAGDEGYGRYYDPVYVNIDPSYIEKFRDEFSDLDPFPLTALKQYLQGEGAAFSSDQLIDMEEFSKSEFYLQFLKPQRIYHMLVIVIARGSRPFAFLGLHRDRNCEPFSEQEIGVANQLSPFLSSLADRVHMADELTLYKRVVDTLSYGLMNKGLLIVDQSLTLIYANDYACITLADHQEFNTTHRNVPAPIIEACQTLLNQGENLSAMNNVNFSMQTDGPQIEGYVRANQVDDSSLLLLAFFNSSEFGVLNPRVCEEFGLTSRELDVVRCVIEGKTNAEVADELHISVRTVQNHLRSIYSKCKVHNRTSLSNRVLSLG